MAPHLRRASSLAQRRTPTFDGGCSVALTEICGNKFAGSASMWRSVGATHTCPVHSVREVRCGTRGTRLCIELSGYLIE